MTHAIAALLLVLASVGSACASAAGDYAATKTTGKPMPTTAPTVEPVAITPTPAGRTVTEPGWTVFASVGGISLTYPSSRVELVALHEANHDGARQLEPVPGIASKTLETRDRGTGSHSAADIVVDPDSEIRSPVTGRVKRAGTYVLYCDYSDDFVVIAPDARPEWEVKILHIEGEQVSVGDRVEAGRSVLAPRPTRLQFESQVDEASASPKWPHVHLEVVDPSIPDRPTPGGGCN